MSATKDVTVNLGTESIDVDLGTQVVTVNVQTIGPTTTPPTTPTGYALAGQLNLGDLGILYVYVQVLIP